MKTEFLEKMIEAKKMEKDAILSLLDCEQREHIQVIEKELMAMLLDIVLKSCIFQKESEKKQSDGEDIVQEDMKVNQGKSKKDPKNTGKKNVQKINIE